MKKKIKYFIILLLLGINGFFLYLFQYIPQYKPASVIPHNPMVCNFNANIHTHFPNAYLYKQLHPYFKKYGFDLQCHKTHPLKDSSLIFVGKNRFMLDSKIKAPAYLWIEETPFSVNIPALKRDEHLYRKIFTYSKKIVDNKKYFYLPLPYDYQNKVLPSFLPLSAKKVLVIQIAGSLLSHSPLNKYGERRAAVEYFVKNHPDDFELYGARWKKMLPQFNDTEKENFSRIYKNSIRDKADAIKYAKFVLAYENAQYDGYISEKIFDVMAAGSVPVYLGAPNITDYVPKECFINREDFATYDDLYDYLKNMSDETYNGYMSCIEDFIRQKHHFNDYETFTNLLLKEIFDNMPLWEKAWFHFYDFFEKNFLNSRFDYYWSIYEKGIY